MIRDRSFGIIPVRKEKEGIGLFLVCHRQGHWSFPKGHPYPGETHLQTASRELYEETGLHCLEFLREEPFTETYLFRRGSQIVEKQVDYYLALVEGIPKIQEDELITGAWTLASDALQILTFHEAQNLCRRAVAFLQSLPRFL